MGKQCKDCKHLRKEVMYWKNLYFGYMRAFCNMKWAVKKESDTFICNCLAKWGKLLKKAERHKSD
jgi:hypothetical protein